MTMCTPIRVAVLLAVVCATAQADEETSNDGSAESPRFRRSDPADFEYRYTRLSRAESVLDVQLVEVVKNEPEKRTLALDSAMLNRNTCFTFAPNYSDPDARIMVRRVIKYISEIICLTFVEVTATIDTSDPNWAMKNGCPSNSLILFNNQTVCISPVGAGSANNTLGVYPCTDPYLGLHEMFHVMSATHSNQNPLMCQAVSLQNENILPQYRYAYYSRTNTFAVAMSTTSTVMYTPRIWTGRGEPTFYCMQGDECVSASFTSTEESIVAELNIRYQCNAFACGNSSTDCGKGYYARVKGTCRCVCPYRLDPATNCSEFINGPNSLTAWPSQATVAAGGADFSCPDGMSPGWITISGSDQGDDASPVPFPFVGKTRYMPLCSATSVVSSDPYNWPFGGNFCFIKPKSYSCGGVFKDFSFEYTNSLPVQYNGTIGDITITGNRTLIKFCCKKEVKNWMNDFPNRRAFRLWTSFDCPNVRGMKSFNYRPRYTVTNATAVGNADNGPNYYIKSFGFYWDMCYYVPPTYGCSMNGSLGIAQRSFTYSTPGFPSARRPNMRCFICASMPIAGFIKATFHTFDLDAADDIMSNRYGDWVDNARIDNSNPPVNLISMKGFMCLEHWSGWTNVSNVGVNLTMETVLAGSLCYNFSSRGADYVGDRNVSELSEPCLNWKDTLDCYESPYTSLDDVLGYLDGNKCRNPGGNLRRPWCFIFKNGTNCIKRYCDVCDLQQTIDYIQTSVCVANKNSTPNFCSSAVQRYGCAKTCNLVTEQPSGCPTNYVPFGRRCMYFTSDLYNRTGAEALCASKGPRGTLFQVQSEDDLNYLRQLRFPTCSGTSTWISGNLDPTGTVWLYSQTNVPLRYTNWSSEIDPYSSGGCCAALYMENGPNQRGGSFWTYKCSDSSALLAVTCQVDRESVCDQPVPPSDGVLTDPLKPFYSNGDRVAVVCKSGSDNNARYMMCQGGSWTTPKYACTECPGDYVENGNICAKYITSTATVGDAENNCKAAATGRNGTLFRVQSVEDFVFARSMRDTYGKGQNDFMYISGRYIGNSTFVYTNTNISATYVNMTTSDIAACKVGQVPYVYRNYSNSARANGQFCTSGSTLYNYICQMDQLQIQDGDRYSTCQAALGRNPKLCLNADAWELCRQSCGISGSPAVCNTPTSATYVRTSNSDTVTSGQYMTFACKDGYFLTSRDTARACSLSGQLLGQAPVCDPNPATVDVGWNMMNPRIDTAVVNNVFLLNRTEFLVPIAGQISRWYCISQTTTAFTMVVYRLVSSVYQLVGYNQVSCYPNTAWGVYVNPSDRISVAKGDIVGAFTTSASTLQVTQCDYFPIKDWQMPSASVTGVSGLATANFNKTICVIPCMGYRVDTTTG